MDEPFDGLSIAQNLSALGFKVLPLKPNDKPPANKNGFTKASSDPDEWHDDWGQWWADPTCNVGIATGVEHPRGGYLVVVDIDRHPGQPDGFVEWEKWCAENGEPPETMSVITPQRGLHLYFLSAEPIPTRGSIRPGIDIKGVGGYVVAPGSITDHGSYVLTDDAAIAKIPTCLLDVITPPKTNVDPVTGEITSEAPQRPSRSIMSGERPGDVWAAQTSWETLLGRVGAIVHPPDRSGKQMVTRPGKDPRDGPSATIGWDGNDALHVFTSNWPPFVPNKSVDKLGVLKAIHGGDLDSALAECRKVTGMDKREPVNSIHAAHTAFLEDTTADTMTFTQSIEPVPGETEFWDSSPELATIYGWAASKATSLWPLLGAILLRILARVPPSAKLPPITGAPGSLNLIVGCVGPSGSGKSIVWSRSEAACYFLNIATQVAVKPLATGQGIPHAYRRKVGSEQEITNTSVLWLVSEVDTLAAYSSSLGSTILAELRKLYSGEQLGYVLATGSQSLDVPAHSYRAGVWVGIQPRKAGFLLTDDETAGGTPQRFLWMPTQRPLAWRGAERPSEPGQLEWRCPDTFGYLDVCAEAIQAIEEADEERAYAPITQTDFALDAHKLLTRLKVAAALGLLEGRPEVAKQDWERAEVVIEVSDRTRAICKAEVAYVAAAKNRSIGNARAGQELQIREALDRSDFDKAVTRVLLCLDRHSEDEGWLSRAALQQQCSGHRQYFAEVVDSLLSAGTIEVRKVNTTGGRPSIQYRIKI